MSAVHAARIFDRAYGGGRNFMTPDVLSLDVIVQDRVAVEISAGRGIMDDPIFGVTFVSLRRDGTPKPRRYRPSAMFYSNQEATAYRDAVAARLTPRKE